MFDLFAGYRTKIGITLGLLVGLGTVAAGIQNGDWNQIGAGLAAIAGAFGVAGIRWAQK